MILYKKLILLLYTQSVTVFSELIILLKLLNYDIGLLKNPSVLFRHTISCKAAKYLVH